MLVLLAYCVNDPPAPTRPKSVDPEAVWVAGAPTGVWVRCDPDSREEARQCVVYNGATGDVEASGLYTVRGTGEAVADADLHYVFADGFTIILRDRRVLDRIESQ